MDKPSLLIAFGKGKDMSKDMASADDSKDPKQAEKDADYAVQELIKNPSAKTFQAAMDLCSMCDTESPEEDTTEGGESSEMKDKPSWMK